MTDQEINMEMAKLFGTRLPRPDCYPGNHSPVAVNRHPTVGQLYKCQNCDCVRSEGDIWFNGVGQEYVDYVGSLDALRPSLEIFRMDGWNITITGGKQWGVGLEITRRGVLERVLASNVRLERAVCEAILRSKGQWKE